MFAVFCYDATVDRSSTCFFEKGWRGTKICNEFRGKKWQVQTVNRFIKKIEREKITTRKEGSGRPRSASTAKNKATVDELIQSQEDKPGSHKPPSRIAKKILAFITRNIYARSRN